MKPFLISVFLLALPLFFIQKIDAACQPIYGGGPTCTDSTFSVQKQVLNPQTALFVHDLGLNDPTYHGNDLIPFQITVTNNGNTAIKQITVTDTFPKELKFSDGPGKYDAKNHTLTFTVSNLASHHAELFTINTYALPQGQFPQDTFCVTNQVSAIPSSGNPSADSSQVCLAKITSTPSTGPSTAGLLALVSMAILGFFIKFIGIKNVEPKNQ